MNSKYLNILKINQDSIPDSVQKYSNSSLSAFHQNKLFYFGFLNSQQIIQPKKKFTFKSNNQQVASQKANFYNIVDKSWSKQQVKGKTPQIRSDYLIIKFQNYILLYGGKSSANKKLNDIHSFSIQTLTWKKLFSIQGPSVSQNNLLIRLSQTKIMLINHQIWTFQLKSVKWQLNSNQLPGGVWQNKGISLDNLKCTKLLNAIAIDQFLLIFYMQQNQLKCSLLDFQHKQVVQIKTSLPISKTQKVTHSQLVRINNGSKKQFAFLINQQIIVFEVQIQANQYKIQVKDKLTLKIDNISNVQCICLTQTHLHFIINRQISTYQIKINMVSKVKQNSSQKKIDKKGTNNQSIAQQSNQQSMIQQKSINNGNNQQRRAKHRHQFMMNSNQNLQNSQSFKDSKLRHSHNYSQNDQQQQNNEVINQQMIKQKIQPLLAYQHLKRVKLEQKSRLLQKQIKQSEKFVLSLICYSQQRQKIKHIQKMKDLRQQLQSLWNKQIFFRKQIQSQDKKIDMAKILKQLK